MQANRTVFDQLMIDLDRSISQRFEQEGLPSLHEDPWASADPVTALIWENICSPDHIDLIKSQLGLPLNAFARRTMTMALASALKRQKAL
jgi:hypothetical protein